MQQRALALFVQRQVEASQFRHAAHADAIAQPGDGDLVGFVHDGRQRRAGFVDDGHGDRIALDRGDRQAKAQRRDQFG